MKILVFNAGRFNSPEGGAVRAKHLFVYPQKHDVVWVDPVYYRDTYDSETFAEEVPSNVTVIPGFKGSRNRAVEWAQREAHFRKAVRTHDVDVAVYYNAWGTLLARRYLKRHRIPVVFDYTDLMHEFRSNPIEKKISRLATTHALKTADAVVATAHVLTEDARGFNQNTHWIPNGVDWKAFQKLDAMRLKPKSVGFVGGFGNWVDFDLFDFDKGAEYYFIGDGPNMAELKKQAKRHSNVHVLGFKPPAEARRYMAAFDICTIPFSKNPLTDAVCPIKLFEYWACGKPVLSTPLKEVKRLSRDSVAFAKTKKDWTKQLQMLIHDKKRSRHLAQNGFAQSKSFNWPHLADKMEKVLQDVQAHRA